MNDINIKNNSTVTQHRFDFNGFVGEYSNIWFVNGLLNLLTLGFYSPWAKIRTQQYFYGSTKLAGGSFQFLANPWVLFRNRLIAVFLFIIFVIAENYAGFSSYGLIAAIVYVVFIAAYIAFSPILLVLMASFRLRFSAWRGINFKFNKDYKGAYRVYLGPTLLVGLVVACIIAPFFYGTSPDENSLDSNVAESAKHSADVDSGVDEADAEGLEDTTSTIYDNTEIDINAEDEYLTEENGETEEDTPINPYYFSPAIFFTLVLFALMPYFDFISNRFLARNVNFGTASARFHATQKDYYRIYGIWYLSTLLFAGLIALIGYINSTSLVVMLIIAAISYFPLSRAYLSTRRYNLLFGNLEIGDGHRFLANTEFLSYFFLVLTNSFAVALSFGLMVPWAKIRTARYYLMHTQLLANSDLNEFIAGQKEDAIAIGEEISDVFDLESVL